MGQSSSRSSSHPRRRNCCNCRCDPAVENSVFCQKFCCCCLPPERLDDRNKNKNTRDNTRPPGPRSLTGTVEQRSKITGVPAGKGRRTAVSADDMKDDESAAAGSSGHRWSCANENSPCRCFCFHLMCCCFCPDRFCCSADDAEEDDEDTTGPKEIAVQTILTAGGTAFSGEEQHAISKEMYAVRGRSGGLHVPPMAVDFSQITPGELIRSGTFFSDATRNVADATAGGTSTSSMIHQETRDGSSILMNITGIKKESAADQQHGSAVIRHVDQCAADIMVMLIEEQTDRKCIGYEHNLGVQILRRDFEYSSSAFASAWTLGQEEAEGETVTPQDLVDLAAEFENNQFY